MGSLFPECGILRPPLHAQLGPCAEVARCEVAPTQSSGKSRERVGERAGRLPRVWKLEWSQVWLPGGVQFDADVSRCREGVDIPLLNVRALGLRQPPVGQVQQLPCEKRAAVASSSRKR